MSYNSNQITPPEWISSLLPSNSSLNVDSFSKILQDVADRFSGNHYASPELNATVHEIAGLDNTNAEADENEAFVFPAYSSDTPIRSVDQVSDLISRVDAAALEIDGKVASWLGSLDISSLFEDLQAEIREHHITAADAANGAAGLQAKLQADIHAKVASVVDLYL